MLFTRSSLNPILKPNKNHEWESRKVYNPGVVYDNGQYHLFYRAVGEEKNWHSSIGYAVSRDEEHFERSLEPVIKPSERIEKKGVEDPRLVKIDDIFYLTYTAYDGISAHLSLATSPDLKTWKKHGEMLENWNAEKSQAFTVPWDQAQNNISAKKHWSKAGGIFPEKINGLYWMVFGSRNLWTAVSEDGISWQANFKPYVKPRIGDFFDNVHVEMGPPPIKTSKGWLILYHGVDNTITYRLGFILTDLNNPKKIIYRSSKPIFEPRANYEKAGLIDILPGGLDALLKMNAKKLNDHIKNLQNKHKLPRVIFCSGATLRSETLRIYYGASDTFICTATANINDILKLSK